MFFAVQCHIYSGFFCALCYCKHVGTHTDWHCNLQTGQGCFSRVTSTCSSTQLAVIPLIAPAAYNPVSGCSLHQFVKALSENYMLLLQPVLFCFFHFFHLLRNSFYDLKHGFGSSFWPFLTKQAHNHSGTTGRVISRALMKSL